MSFPRKRESRPGGCCNPDLDSRFRGNDILVLSFKSKLGRYLNYDINYSARQRKYPRFILHTSNFILFALLASCASQQPPPGGPVDKTPPAIDSVFPAHRAINVSENTRIYFHFARDIDKASFEQAFSITPYLIGTPKFHWSGHDEVYVVLPEHLRDSTTYCVQLSRDLKSRHGVQLASPSVLTFSTGPLIDTGTLSGFLLMPFVGAAMKPSDLFVFAYDFSTPRADTLNFSHTPPDILTQPDDKGIWKFFAMKTGHRYRVYAIGDVYRNKVYDAGVDALGVPSGDATLDSAAKTGFYIRMAPPTDTTKPDFQDVEVVDSFHLRAHFSEAIDSNDVRAASFKMKGNPFVAAYRESPEKKPSQITLVTKLPLVPNQNDTIEAVRDSIHDLSHNPLSDSAYKVTFTSPASLRSASPPKIDFIGVRDSMTDVSGLPSFPIVFTDAVQRDSVEHSILLIDTGHHAVPTIFKWADDAKVRLSPKDSLISNVFYTLEIKTRGVQSPVAMIGSVGKDTVLRRRFRTANVHDFGKITGNIHIADSFITNWPKSTLVVQVLENGTNIVAQKILPHGEKHYEFNQMPTSTFRVRAYFSKSDTAAYDPGSIIPWRFGVPSGEYPKEFDTRPRWSIDNIDFDVK